jgi:biopolymer transport protein ExbD
VKLHTSARLLDGPFSLAPLVDVVLLLLIFFLLGSTFVMQPGVQIDLPDGLTGLGSPHGRRVLTVTAAGEIYFDDQLMDLAALSGSLEAFARKGVDQTVVIKADVRVPHGTVMEVLRRVLASGLDAVVASREGEG